MANIFKKLFGGGKKSQPSGPQPPSYSGPTPFTLAEARLKIPSINQFESQIGERSKGHGLVGFDPSRRNILRQEYGLDFDDYSQKLRDQASAQASGQGLRGGVPVSIQSDLSGDLARARQAGLAQIDISDLEARREDINRATYAQPDFARLLAGIQEGAAGFGQRQYEFQNQPFPIEREPSILPSLIEAGSTLGAAYLGNKGQADQYKALIELLNQNQRKY